MRRVLLWRKCAAQDHWRAEKPEVTFGNMNAMQLLRPVAGQVEAGARKVERGHFLEDAFLVLIDVKERDGRQVGREHALATRLRAMLKLHDAVRVRIGERLDQHSVHHAEDGRVGTDAQRQCGDGCDRKSWVLQEHLQRMLQIVPHVRHR